MINIENDILKKYINPDTIKPEAKKEHELNAEDKVYLINKKIDENFLLKRYEDLINKKNYIINNNIVNINDYVYNDIEFLHDHYLDITKGIFNKLDLCQTKIGSLIFQNILIKPLYDIKVLKSRQVIFQKVESIKEQLTMRLEKVKTLENELIWCWNDANMKHIDSMNDLIYFNYDFIPFFNLNDTLNNNEKALLITNIYKIVIAPALTILTPLISIILPLIFLFYMQRKSQINIPMGTVISQYFRTLFSSDSMKMIFKNPTKAMIASIVTKGIYLFMYMQNIYYSLQSSSNTNKIINTIHDKMNALNNYIKITNEIKDLSLSVGITDITSYINYDSIENDISVYGKYFNHDVFNKTPHIFSNKGKILHTFKNFRKCKDNMENLFHYTGTIDALLSIYNILSQSNSVNPYCLASYLDKKVPKVNMKNVWHPYLKSNDIKNTVKNDLDIKNNILITGPNAAGKSTFIKSVIINILLAQTIGICSAEKFEITPFRMIETYLHIPDSKGSSSLFEAEMFRSKEYIDKLKNMDNDHFSFIVLDEIFSSTNYVEGFSGAYSILKKIASFKNTLSITTTHYTDLEILEKDTKGRIVNYKFDIDHDINGEILFNYILKKGTSRQYIALELLKKNGFDEDVIENALEICDKIKNKKLIFFKKK